ncbi:tetraacyldisaccharide 4'-kinase [Litoribacillus peritrichatus]|uniref:Tetraacyldisaccharide 4'-kinase n=1 Tax=Litoribacillus peritrichatus TaxID=718191 RepID=A0ABP7N536_9GAMM
MSGIEQAWYQGAKWLKLLRPFSFLAEKYASSKRQAFLSQPDLEPFIALSGHSVPLIVVGNISVGGTGKTPFTIALAQYLSSKGKRVGVVSRGYGSKRKTFPYEVLSESTTDDAGDEPLLIKQRLDCPVVIDPDRVSAVNFLLSKHDVDVLISDDGLQHYKMNRSLEIVLVDGGRGLGNGRMLPEGPLRESVARLDSVDFVVVNSPAEGFPELEGSERWADWFKQNAYTQMSIVPGDFYSLANDQQEVITGEQVYAVSGIGNPERFYNTLTEMRVKYLARPFRDHHDFSMLDFVEMVDYRIAMTEKDAVKCRSLDLGNAVYLSVNASLEERFFDRVFDQLFT